MNLQGAIIAGGDGRRLGTCLKALLPTPSGSSLLQKNVSLLRELCGRKPLLSTNSPASFANEVGLDTILEDDGPKIGPLGGFLSTLRRTKADALIFVAGDMPFLEKTVLESFVDEFRKSQAQSLWAVIDGFGQPFPSILSKECLITLEAAAKTGLFSIQKIFRNRLSMAVWSEESKCALDPEGRSFNNINSFADLEDYLSLSHNDVLELLSHQNRAQPH